MKIKKLFAVIRIPASSWNNTQTMHEQAGWEEHARFMDNLTTKGFILLGGPLTDSREILLVVSAGSEQEVRMTLQLDPWEQAGILMTKQVSEWQVLLDSRKA